MEKIKKHISIVLLLLFGLIFTPKAYLHSLYGHEDTCCLPHPDLRIEKIHYHCKILQLNTPIFLAPAGSFPEMKPACFPDAGKGEELFVPGVAFAESPPRAPPTIC